MLATALPNQRLTTIATNNCFYAARARAQATPPTAISATAASAGATAITTCLPAISPTFIEHKYSANTFKEKFYANLRQHHNSSNNSKLRKLKTINNNIVSNCNNNNNICSNNSNKNAYQGKVINGSGLKVVGGGSGNSSVVEVGGNSITKDKNNKIPTFSNNCITSNGETTIIGVCSIKKQLNENVKSNLYKKFIN